MDTSLIWNFANKQLVSMGGPEQAIQITASLVRAMVLHSILNRPESTDLELWPFAVLESPAAEFFTNGSNQTLHRCETSLIWPLTASSCVCISSFCVEPQNSRWWETTKLDIKKLQSFLSYSHKHSTLVGQVMNMSTGSVAPLFHAVYEDFVQKSFHMAICRFLRG